MIGYAKAVEGYDLKEIFTTKLHGEPFDVQLKNLAKDMQWLIAHEVFREGHRNRYGEQIYICRYPIRIWYHQRKATWKVPYGQLNRDWLEPGDIWIF